MVPMCGRTGYKNAQSNLGLVYDNGRGVKQDVKEAIKWYRCAAEQGFASVQFNLGTMYDNGASHVLQKSRWSHKTLPKQSSGGSW